MSFRITSQPRRLPTGRIIGSCVTVTSSIHGELFPNNVRCLICGPSNCGKTNVLIAILLEPNGLKFENVYLYSKTLYQPAYSTLAKILSMVPEIGFHYSSCEDEIISFEEVKRNSVIVFDDVMPKDFSHVTEFYSKGRHKNVNPFFLTQTYTAVQKQLLRDNVNLLICFKMDRLNLYCIYRDHVEPDYTFAEFTEMCRLCWLAGPFSFLTIAKDYDINKGRYRSGLDKFISKKNNG